MTPCRPFRQSTRPGLFSIGIFALAAALLAGCGSHQDRSSDKAPHLHVDTPPHGGTPVALGDDYQIEWVLDAPSGLLQAYFLDGEMENFVRIAAPSFELKAKLPGREEVLHSGRRQYRHRRNRRQHGVVRGAGGLAQDEHNLRGRPPGDQRQGDSVHQCRLAFSRGR